MKKQIVLPPVRDDKITSVHRVDPSLTATAWGYLQIRVKVWVWRRLLEVVVYNKNGVNGDTI